ncbi:MAG: hypothetical protein ACE5QW_09550 [Thermoplasmata archaeon]
MRIIGILVGTIILFSAASALPTISTDHAHIAELGDADNWRVEVVNTTTGGSPDISLALDKDNTPKMAFYPPGEVRYAHRMKSGWEAQTIGTSPWGGAPLCLALDSSGLPHIMYDGIGWIHAWFDGFEWFQEVVAGAGPGRKQCDAFFDSSDNLHVAYTTDPSGLSPGEVKYAFFDGSSWTIQKVDDGGIMAMWASVAVLDKDPYLLYYADTYQEVRFAFREDQEWEVELVENAGFIQYIGSHGSLGFDSLGRPHAAYVAFVRYERNEASLRYATRISDSWHIETVDGPPGMKGLYASMRVGPLDEPHIATIRLDVKDPVSLIFDEDLVYHTFEEGSWTQNTVIHGEGGSPRPWLTSLDVDSCGQPHIATYILLGKKIQYATKGPPCIAETPRVVVDIDPDTLNLKSNGRWTTAYLRAENASVRDIDISTIILQDALAPERWDYQDDILMLKFSRQEFKDTVQVGESVQVKTTGMWEDGTCFEAYDSIRVINRGKG